VIESRRLPLKQDETHWWQDEMAMTLGGVTVWDGTGTTEAHTASVCRLHVLHHVSPSLRKRGNKGPKRQGNRPHTPGLV
jgi:hypothetical protein